MNPYLIEFQLPLVFKSLFGGPPMGVYLVLLLGGLALMFLPEPRSSNNAKKAQAQGGGGEKAADPKARKLLFALFFVGFGLFLLGLIGVGVAALNNDETQEEAYSELLQNLYDVAGGVDSLLEEPLAAQELRRALDREILSKKDPAQEEYWEETIAFERAETLHAALEDLYPPLDLQRLAEDGEAADLELSAEQREEAAQAVREAWAATLERPETEEYPLQQVRIPSYGVMIMLGFLAAIAVSYMRARVYKLDPNVIIDMGIIAMVGGIVGARLFHVFEYWSEAYARDPATGAERTFGEAIWQAFQIQQGGLVFYGGLIVAAAAILIYLKVRKLPILFYMDIGAMAVPLGLAFGRIGCFLNGCCWGIEASAGSLFAVYYESAKTYQDVEFVAGTPLIASQLVASLAAFTLFVLLTVYYQFVARKRGETLAMLFILYGINRFFNQMLRGDVPAYGDGDLLFTSSQWIALATVVLGLVAWFWLRYKRPHELPPRRLGVELERHGVKQLTADGKIPPVPGVARVK